MQKRQSHIPAGDTTPSYRATRHRTPPLWSRLRSFARTYRLSLAATLMAAAAGVAMSHGGASTPEQPVAHAAPVTPVAPPVLVPVHAATQVSLPAATWADDPRYAEVILNATTGEIIFDRNAEAPRNVASMAKVMTAYIVFEAIRNGEISLDTQLTASEFAASRECSCFGKHEGRELQVGDTMTVREALHALMAGSYNDVATMVAEGVSGSEAAFTARMTQTAARIGAENSVFGTASGLEADDATALDVAVIFNRMTQDFPQLYGEFFTPARITLRGEERDNCRLCAGGRFDANADGRTAGMQATGQKTGYHRASGFSMVAEFTRAGERYIVVTMGADNNVQRHNRAAALAQAAAGHSAPAATLVAETPRQTRASLAS